ncbi:hypothetical protein [Sulfurospirillum oryzae]|uniref:hypothetical protein n=1 Tax=Sulfurospirillum oryzae TaxID=2976535 RepID=UPI0021E84B81|nr:hypothetical protein [Sulfurospirillum oryzae]
MILAFEFNYVSNNGILENLLKEIVSDFGISHKIIRKETIVTLFVEADETVLGTFADTLSASLPLSIFFKSSSVEVVDAMPNEDEVIPLMAYRVEFTPKILAAVDTPNSSFYLSPFGITSNDAHLKLLQNSQELLHVKDAAGYEALYEKVAELIAAGENVAIKIKNGHFVFGKIENINACSNIKKPEVIATDLSVVERMVVIRENEIKALATLERPSIRLKVNAMFAQKEILNTSRIMLHLADDLLLYQLCKRLFAKGILFLFKASLEQCKAVYTVDFDVKQEALEPLVISVLENGAILIVEGQSYASNALKASLKKFDEPSHAAFAAIMQEHQLFDTTSSCVYLSKTHNDRIMHYSKEHGMLNLVEVLIPTSFAELFAEVERSSPSAERLVANYKEQFPEIYAKALETIIPSDTPKNIYSLWKIMAIALGLSDDFDRAASKLIENAEDFGGQKGPRIDYFLEKEDALSSDLNYVKLLRSGISYKLAGTDDTTLSFGYMESLSYFISDMADSHKEHFGNLKIALAGSLFGYKRLTEMLVKNLKPNHTLCFNKELPIDL